MSSEKTSVQVAVRIRPITSQDLATLPTRFQKSVLSAAPYAPNQVIVAGEKKQYFSYDYVFGPETTQKDVYDKSVLKLIDKFLEGYNVTILAYGQTSSGKTFTMGTSDNESIEPDDKGIIPRAVSTLFSSMNSAQYKTRKFSIKVSFIEIYNEDLIDLLGEGDDESRPQVLIREDSKGNILWSGLQEIKVNSVEDVIAHLTRGSLNRQTGATDMNAQSSRSHAIFSVTLAQQKFVSTSGSAPSPQPSNEKSGVRPPSRSGSRLSRRLDEGEWVSITSKFHFVDLAGSERLKRTSAIGDRAKEGISINSGLLALGNVISALGDPNKAKHTTHIPYRDSKLTRLLQDSLGGNAQTLMIACVTPAEYNLHETVNTLKYANRARNIKNNATINAEESGWNDLEHLQNLVMKLRNEIRALKAAGGIVTSNGSSTNGTTSGRTTPSISGRETPSHIRRPSTPSNIPMMSQQQPKPTQQNNKDIETLEEQLQLLQRSYAKLSQRYAKTSAELAKHQDNEEGLNSLSDNIVTADRNSLSVIKEVDDEEMLLKHAKFQEVVEPVIEEYEKSFTSLESQLAITKAALSHSESVLQEQQGKLDFAEHSNEQNKIHINELKNKIAKFTERESTSERYIKDLENKLEKLSLEQKKDQDLINDLRSEIAHMRANGTNSEGYIQDLENKLSISEKQATKLTESVEKLENRLQQRETSYQELEKKLRRAETDEDKELLLIELDNREKRISHLEQKVEALVNELEELKNLNQFDERDEYFSHLRDDTTISNDTFISTRSITPGANNDPMIIATLESRFTELHKTHEQTLKEFEDIKLKYQSCLLEIHELQNQLTEAKLIQSEVIKSTPSTPMSPQSPGLGSSFRLSLPPIIPLDEANKSLNDNLVTLKHKRSQSFSAEFNREKKDSAHILVIQRLHNELQQLSSLHEDKAQGLDAVKQEFARLEMSYRETLDIVEELREEIKRRDALAQLEVMSVITNEHAGVSYCSVNTSEIDELEIVQRLREEVEQLKEEQRITMESLSEREKRTLKKHDEMLNIESNIKKLQEELREKQKDDVKDDERVIELQSHVKELEQELIKAQDTQRQEQMAEAASYLEGTDTSKESNEEILVLRRQVEKLQDDIESKGHTIAALLLPSDEHQNNIRRLEDKLQEVREAQRQVTKDKHGKSATMSENIKDEDNSEPNYSVTLDKEQNVNETVKILDEEAKELEVQIINAKEAQHIPTPRTSLLHLIDPTQRDISKLQEKLSDLQKELATKSESGQNLKAEQELIVSLQSQLEILKNDIKRKYELIEVLKRDLVDKGMIQQKLREKESEASVLQSQLSSVKKHNSEMQHQMEVLQSQLLELESSSNGDLNLHPELENVRKELKEVKENEKFAVERLRILNAEESKLQQDLQRLHREDIAQKERINVLESRLSQEDLAVDGSLVALRSELALSKEAEAMQKQKISDLENKLEVSEAEVNSLQHLISEESQLKTTIQELETKLSEAEKENEKIQKMKDEINLLKELDTEHELKIEQLKHQLEVTQSEKDAAIEELESMKKDFAVQKELAIKFEGEIKNIREELIKANEQNADSVKKLEELTNLMNNTKKLQDEEEKNKTLLENELEMLKAAREISDNDKDDLETELAKLKTEKEDRNKLLSEIESRIIIAEKERDQYAERVNELTKMLETKEIEMKEAVAALENKVSDLQSQFEQVKESSKVDQETIESLEEKLATLNSQLKNAKESDEKHAQLVRELEVKLNESNALLSEKEQSLSDKKSKYVELEAIIEKTRAELEILKESENDKNDQIKQLETDLERAKFDEIEQAELIIALESQLQEAEVQRDDYIFKLQEIETLKEKCSSLQNNINEVQNDSLSHGYSNVDENVVEDLSKELKKVQEEAYAQKERADTLQKKADKLQSEKNNQLLINADLAQQVEVLQKDLETLAEEFSETVTKQEDDEIQMKERISELEADLEANRNSQLGSRDVSSPTLAKLAAANENLRQTNYELNNKIEEAEKRASSLSERIKTLENELECIKSENNGSSVDSLNAKIQELEYEKRKLEQANESSFEERQKLDQTIESLMQQLQTSGHGGDKTATHLAELNAKILSLEKEISQAKRRAKEDTSEIVKLKEVNEQLEQELSGSTDTIRDSGGSLDSGYVSQTSSRTLKNPSQAKYFRQESTIAQQNNLIKALQDKIYKLERQSEENSRSNTPIGMPIDLDAVGGYRAISPTNNSRKSSVRATPPPTPPPNQPLPRVPHILLPNSSSPGALPKIPLSPRPDSRTGSDSSDLTCEKLQKRIAKLEGDNFQNRQLVDTLETSLNDSETNLRVAKQQLQVLQRDKSDLINQMKSLKMQLEDAAAQYEQARNSVQQEKKVIESVLLEERKAKEQAERSRRQLESRMEELMAKKSKFMCF